MHSRIEECYDSESVPVRLVLVVLEFYVLLTAIHAFYTFAIAGTDTDWKFMADLMMLAFQLTRAARRNWFKELPNEDWGGFDCHFSRSGQYTH